MPSGSLKREVKGSSLGTGVARLWLLREEGAGFRLGPGWFLKDLGCKWHSDSSYGILLGHPCLKHRAITACSVTRRGRVHAQ